jgi:hypothetical protein
LCIIIIAFEKTKQLRMNSIAADNGENPIAIQKKERKRRDI